jgi:hypothetical protein
MRTWKKTVFGSFGLHIVLLIGVALYFAYREPVKPQQSAPEKSGGLGSGAEDQPQNKKMKPLEERELGDSVPEAETEFVIEQALAKQEEKLASMSDEKKEAELQRGANLLRRSNVQEVEKAADQILSSLLPQENHKESGGLQKKATRFDPNSAFYFAVRKEGDNYIFVMKDKNGFTLDNTIHKDDMDEEDMKLYRIYELKNKYAQFSVILDKVSEAATRMSTPEEPSDSALTTDKSLAP